MTDYRRYLNLTTMFLLASIFFFVPLLLHPKTSEVFEFNKMMFTYAAVSLALAVATSKHLIYRTRPLTAFPLRWPWLFLISSQIICTIFSIDPHTSIWGFYSRFHGGLASTIAYFLIYYLIFDIARELPDQDDRRDKFSPLYHKPGLTRLLITSILSSSVLVAVYAVLEHFGIDKTLWIQDVQNRVFSTLGQPNWLSAYLVALLPLGLFSAATATNRFHRFSGFAYALLLYFSILFTKSRSGIGATFIIIVISLISLISLIILRRHPTSPKTPIFLTISLVSLISLITLIVGSPFTPALRSLGQVGAKPIISNIAAQLNPPAPAKLVGGSDSMQIRQIVWSGAIELFRKHPLVGTGLETFGYSYYWVRPVSHNLLSEWDFLYNKAHNEYINYLATTGIVGTSAYLIFILSSLVLFLKSIRSPLGLPLLLGYLSILITNYFGFSVVPVALFFYTFPALAYLAASSWKGGPASSGDSFQVEAHQHPNFSTTNTILLCLVAFAALGAVSVIFIRWQADMNYNQGKNLATYRYILPALPYLEKAVAAYPQEYNFRAQLAETQAQIAAALDDQIKTATSSSPAQLEPAKRQLQALINNSLRNMDQAYRQNPYHLNLLKTKAKVEINLAFIDSKYYQDALATLIKANELAPTDPKITYNIGLIYDHLGQSDQASLAFQKALDLKPNYDQARVSYITLLQEQGKIEDAQAQLKLLLADYPEYKKQYEGTLLLGR